MVSKYLQRVIVLALLIVSVLGCDSSDNDGFFGAALVEIDARPELIDIGDSSFVTVKVDDLDDDSIFVKVRFPIGLDYLVGSGFIKVNNQDVPREPDMIFTQNQERKNYVIFFLARTELEDRDETVISFDLVGESRVSDSDIEVDADIDDRNIDNSVEISESDPEFQAEDGTKIQVR